MRSVIIVFLIAALHVPLRAQGEMVIHKEGTELYHRAGCPVIKDGEGVLAMTRAQAESRGYKPHPACDPAQQPAAAPTPNKGAATPEPTVYLDKSKYYHRKDCRRLKAAKGQTVEAQSLEIAAKTRWPCPTCKPPIRRRSSEPAVPGTGGRGH